MLTTPGEWPFLHRRKDKMKYESDKYKTVEQLRKQLHNIAASHPNANMFTREGRQAWSEWSEACREIESELRVQGEVF